MNKKNITILALLLGLAASGCTGTVKAVGDPDRPITIRHYITIDIKGLEQTATNIEDYVSGDKPIQEVTNEK